MAPTRARHGVVGFAVTLAIITYIDRMCISQTESNIRGELGLSILLCAPTRGGLPGRPLSSARGQTMGPTFAGDVREQLRAVHALALQHAQEVQLQLVRLAKAEGLVRLEVAQEGE